MAGFRHVCWLLLAVLLPATTHAVWLERTAAIMGTRIKVELNAPDEGTGAKAIDAVLGEFHRIDRLMSPYQERSELARVNREASQAPVKVSSEFFRLLQRSLEFSRLTQGAFDITFASVGHHYDYRKGIAPSDTQIASDLPKIDYRHIVLDPDRQTVFFSQKGVRIDLGGIAKGYAVDRAIGLLQSRGIEQALVSAGGDSRILGDHDGRPWNIGIRAPRDRHALVAVLPLNDSAVSTSGDYERFFEAGGIRHHHIISPKTGRSAGDVQSVTIIGPDATSTDALSTSVFVMGPAAGLELIDRLEKFEAIIIDRQGEMRYSIGLQSIGR